MMTIDAPWSVAPCEKTGCDYTIQEIRSLDVEAVRLCDGYEYRYHRGGMVSFFSMRTREELPVSVVQGLPTRHWWHRAGCGCSACSAGPWKDAEAHDALRPLPPPL
jgi:hypothetical protein